jgi:hypothetical protein
MNRRSPIHTDPLIQTDYPIQHTASIDPHSAIEDAFSIQQGYTVNQQGPNIMQRQVPSSTDFPPQHEAHDNMTPALPFGMNGSFVQPGTPQWQAAQNQATQWQAAQQLAAQWQADYLHATQQARAAHIKQEVDKAYEQLNKPPSLLVNIQPITWMGLTPMEFKVVCLSPSHVRH